MKIPNFVHGALFALGAYITFSLVAGFGTNYYLGVVISACAMFFGGAFLEWGVFRRTYKSAGIIPLVVAIGLSFVLENVMTNIWTSWPQNIPTPLSSSIVIFGASILQHRVAIIVSGWIFALGLYAFLSTTKMGRAIRAVSQDSDAASLMGVRIGRVYTITFGIGVSLAAIAGSLIGPVFSVYPTMGDSAQLVSFAIIILGGMGNLLGAVVGAILIGFASTYVVSYVAPLYGEIVAFAIMIIILLLKPKGLFGSR
jgi:branched-chain amino acid transport system permease protein